LNHSSRKDPCPVCGRDRDDKCRWNDNFIFCYRGDKFSPPDLRVGQVLEVAGWPRLAVVAVQGGFAGGSVVLAPDEKGKALQAARPPTDGIAKTATARAMMVKVRKKIRVLNSSKEFCTLKIEDLRTLTSVALEAKDLTLKLKVFVRANRVLIKRQGQIQLNLRDSEKTLKYFLLDLSSFIENNLGCKFNYDC
jgi:hypothetical protein